MLLCLLFVVLFVVLANAGLYLFRRLAPANSFSKNREAAGLFFGALSLLYSLIIAFVIVAAWDDYEELRGTIDKETDRLVATISDVRVMPDSLGRPFRQAVIGYAKMVTDDEWNTDRLQLRRPVPLFALRELAARYSTDLSRKQVLDRISDRLEEISDLRRERLGHLHSHVPGLIWGVLIAGTVLIVLFCYFFTTDRAYLQHIWLSMVSIMSGACLFVVYLLDHPFISAGIDREAYATVIRIAEE